MPYPHLTLFEEHPSLFNYTKHNPEDILSSLKQSDPSSYFILSTLYTSNDPNLIRRSTAILTKCYGPPTLFRCSRCGEVHHINHYCRSRICPKCAGRRTTEQTDRYLPRVHTMTSPRLITLTQPAIPAEPLSHSLSRLKRSFRRFSIPAEKGVDWKTYLTGGLYVIEPKWTGYHWHVHAHVIADPTATNAVIRDKLEEGWSEAQDTSFVHIDVRNIQRGALKDTLRYVFKPSELSTLPADKLTEYARSIHNVRLVSTFGDTHQKSRNSRPLPARKRYPRLVCTRCGATCNQIPVR